MKKKQSKKLVIRNSTVEFLIFTSQGAGDPIEVRYENETIWLTQKLMAQLFSVDRSVITKHLQNIFNEKELDKNLVCANFAHTAGDKKKYKTLFYSLDAIISVGYRVNSTRATQFRQWATHILREFAIKGYILDKERMENGTFLNKDYFEHLLAEIREIRLSERRFYQKITDIYSTSIDYNKSAPITQEFFAKVQNKLHYAIHGQTAGELIKRRASSKKKDMGLSSWENSPTGKILKTDVAIAKNYLTQKELESMSRIVSAYLDLAEDRAKRKIPMTMEDWSNRLDQFLAFDERPILKKAGKISKDLAKKFAESEFEKYRIIQDKLFESDFDKEMKKIEQQYSVKSKAKRQKKTTSDKSKNIKTVSIKKRKKTKGSRLF